MISKRNFFSFLSLISFWVSLWALFGLSEDALALTFSNKVPPAVQSQMLGDLQLVQQIQGTGATPIFAKMFSGPLGGVSLTQFFTTRIFGVDLNNCGGGAAAACVIPKINDHVMFLTPNFVNLPIPQIYRISIVFHESRHTETAQNNWGHVICPTPFKDAQGKDIRGIISGTLMQGLPACDNTPFGAYALQAELLKNVQYFCSNCNDKIKMDAKLFGDDTVNRISDARALQVLRTDVQLAQ